MQKGILSPGPGQYVVKLETFSSKGPVPYTPDLNPDSTAGSSLLSAEAIMLPGPGEYSVSGEFDMLATRGGRNVPPAQHGGEQTTSSASGLTSLGKKGQPPNDPGERHTTVESQSPTFSLSSKEAASPQQR